MQNRPPEQKSADNQRVRSTSSELPGKFTPGYRLKASDMNAIVDTIRGSDNIWSANLESVRPTTPQMVQGSNDSAGAIGVYQCVELTGGVIVDPLVVAFDVPSADSVELVAVTAQYIASGKVGWLYTQGEFLVQYTGAIAIGELLGSQSGSTIVAAQADGNLVCIDTTVISGTNYALVRMAIGGGGAGTYVTPTTIGTTAEAEAARADTWDRTAPPAGTDGVIDTRIVRFAYNDAGDEILYAYYRNYLYDSIGALVAVSAETRVTIDVPEACVYTTTTTTTPLSSTTTTGP